MERFAIVTGARSANEVQAYLPSGYAVIGSKLDSYSGKLKVFVCGEDNAGWTLDDYVIPRLASGLMGCTESDHGSVMESIHNTQ